MTRFGAETTAGEVLAGVDLRGRTAVVTGASTGLGLETARALAAAGAHVVLAVRDDAKAEAAMASIRADAGSASQASLDCGTLDLADLATVRAFAERFRSSYSRLELLVNNAGVMFTPFGRTAQGFESQFGVNHVGHFVLTAELFPLLAAAGGARVVNLSSAGHAIAGINWDDPNYRRRPYDKFEAYGQSKTANALFTVELDRRGAADGVRSFAVHPGRIRTRLSRHMDRADAAALMARARRNRQQGRGRGMPSFKSIPAGAATTVWAAAAPELDGRGGLYCSDCAVSKAAPHARDPGDAARLWSLTEELLARSG